MKSRELQLPLLGVHAQHRQRNVRNALVSLEVSRHRAIRALRLASRQCAGGSPEWQGYQKLLETLQAFDLWRS